MKRLLILALGLPLVACGAQRDLQPVAGQKFPPPPYGATARPTTTQLLTPTSQQRPQRSDDVLTSSEERQGNEFDLPPAK